MRRGIEKRGQAYGETAIRESLKATVSCRISVGGWRFPDRLRCIRSRLAAGLAVPLNANSSIKSNTKLEYSFTGDSFRPAILCLQFRAAAAMPLDAGIPISRSQPGELPRPPSKPGTGPLPSRQRPVPFSAWAIRPTRPASRGRAACADNGVPITTRAQGRLAQLVERFLYTEDVGGSSPSSPTTLRPEARSVSGVAGAQRKRRRTCEPLCPSGLRVARRRGSVPTSLHFKTKPAALWAAGASHRRCGIPVDQFTASLRPLPALNFGSFEAGI